MGLAGVVGAVDLEAVGGLVGDGEVEVVARNGGDVRGRNLAVVIFGVDILIGGRHGETLSCHNCVQCFGLGEDELI